MFYSMELSQIEINLFLQYLILYEKTSQAAFEVLTSQSKILNPMMEGGGGWC